MSRRPFCASTSRSRSRPRSAIAAPTSVCAWRWASSMPIAAFASVCATPSCRSRASRCLVSSVTFTTRRRSCASCALSADVLERDARGAGERLDHRLVVLGERVAVDLVHRLKHAKPRAVPRVDGRHQHRPGAVAGSRVDAGVEPRVAVWVVDPKHAAAARDLGCEAAPIQRQADLAQLALGEDARPDLRALVIDDVHRGPLRAEQGRGGIGDPSQDHVDVGLERELALERQQERELLGLARAGAHPPPVSGSAPGKERLRTVSSVSISLTGLSGRSRAIRGKRMA